MIICLQTYDVSTSYPQLYDWLQEHEARVLDMFHQFDAKDEEGNSRGHVTKENFVVCLQTLSKLMTEHIIIGNECS